MSGIRDDEHLRTLVDGFATAALGGSWATALQGLADATGAAHGQMIGVGSDAAVPFNWITDLDPGALIEWLEMDGANPANNARVRAGLAARELDVLRDAEFASEEELRGPVYDLYRRYGIGQGLQTTLHHDGAFVVGLATLRPDDRGDYDAEARRALATLAPHVRSAVTLQMMLEGQAAGVVAGAFEALHTPAFICSAEGQVIGLTPQAEELASTQTHLSVTGRRLRAVNAADQPRLARAIAAATTPWPAAPQLTELVVRPRHGGQTLHLQVAPLPKREFAFRLNAAALVVARPSRTGPARGPYLQEHYGLTPAETEIAIGLADGRSLHEIAEERRVTVATLRSQLKSAFGKLGVRRQAQLTAKVNDL